MGKWFQKKIKIVFLQQCIPNLAYTLSSVSVVLDLATVMDMQFFLILNFGVVP